MIADNLMIIISCIYIAILLLIALLVRRDTDSDGYLIANRRLGGMSSALTIIASKIGAGLMITFSVLVFAYGMSAIALFIGYVVGYTIFYFFARKLHTISHTRDLYTMGDYYRLRFGEGTGKAMAIISALSMFGWILTNFIGGSKIISYYSNADFWLSCLIVALVITVYILLAGFKAVVRTDAVQVIALFAIMIAILYTLIYGNTNEIVVPIFSNIPVGESIVFFITGILFPLGSAELWERVIATESLKDLKRSLIAASIGYFVFGITLASVCLLLQGSFSNISADTRLIVGLSSSVPHYFSGLIIIAFASAILSSADTFVFSTCTLLAHGFYGPRQQNAQKTASIVKKLISPIIIAAFIFSIIFHEVIDVTYYFASITLGLGSIALFAWFKSKLTGPSVSKAAIILIIAVTVTSIIAGISNILPIIGILSVLVTILLSAFFDKIGN